MSRDGDSATARLFIALELPPDWREDLSRIQREVEAVSPGYFRWVRPELLHLTMLFLGDQPRMAVEGISDAVQRAARGVARFDLRLGELTTFGSPRAPRVLGVGASAPGDALRMLRLRLAEELRLIGVPFDDKPFRPHVTLARANRAPIGRYRQAAAAPRVAPRRVDSVMLIESRLRPGGPEYSAVRRARLG